MVKIRDIVARGGGLIRKLSKEQKRWYDKRSRKILKQKSKEKEYRKYKGRREFQQNYNANKNEIQSIKIGKNEYIFIVPDIFSIRDNPEATIQFFNQILSYRNKHRFGMKFFIDSANVIKVTVDALLYLIAIISDTKYNSTYNYIFAGNLPKSDEAKRVYEESGFMTFVHTKNKIDITPQTNNIKILRGENVDSPVAAKVCQFVQDNCGYLRKDTISLYNILVEMMSNTKQHAYKYGFSSERRAKFWYLYAEEKDNSVSFVFLDTGLGIPTTVRKNWGERIPFVNKDADFIKSALRGDFRTQTLEKNRGKGLPQISESFQSGFLDNIFIFSGKGCCKLSKSKDDYETIDFKNKIFGTLFYWEISKCKEEVEYDNY